jgi:hypothetical protein
MSIENLSLLANATMSTTGGTAQVYESLGLEGGLNPVFVQGDTNLKTRRTADFSVVPARVDTSKPSGYTQMRANLFSRNPVTLASGDVSVDTSSVRFAHSVETTAAQKLEQRQILAQMLIDPDLTSFWDNGSLS